MKVQPFNTGLILPEQLFSLVSSRLYRRNGYSLITGWSQKTICCPICEGNNDQKTVSATYMIVYKLIIFFWNSSGKLVNSHKGNVCG